MSVKVKNGFKEFNKNLRAFKKAMPEINKEVLHNYARHIIIRASENTPIMWGNLQDHWKFEDNSKGKSYEVYIINDLPYASFVEEGHKLHNGFVPGRFVPTPGGIKFQYMPWVKGEGIMLHGGWVEGKRMFEITMNQMESENVLKRYGGNTYLMKWNQIMGN